MNEHYITDVLIDDESGVVIVLDNGLKYAVDPGDASTASMWYGSQRVRVDPSRGPNYTTTITNLSDKLATRSVKAHKVIS